MYRRAAELIVAAEDPRRELLLVAQLETEYLRRRTMMRGISVALVLIGVAWFALFRGGAEDSDPSQWAVDRQAEWALEQNRVASHVPLPRDVEKHLRVLLNSPSSRVRRAALVALTKRGSDVDPKIIVEFIRGVPESLDVPEHVASADGQDDRRALEEKRRKTMRAATHAAWIHCARHHTFTDHQVLEDALSSPDLEVQRYVIRALTELPDYRLPAPLWERIRQGQPALVEEATALLRRGMEDK